jgi:NADH-quinone oxidoreductase subunit A
MRQHRLHPSARLLQSISFPALAGHALGHFVAADAQDWAFWRNGPAERAPERTWRECHPRLTTQPKNLRAEGRCATKRRNLVRRSGRMKGRTYMPELLREYLPVVIFLGVALGFSLILLIAPILIAIRNPDPEKLSAYECGFNAFDDARMKFDVRFYLVSILFIIFDLEVAFLFPWAITLGDIGLFGFWSMMIFLGVLTIGFIYEWRKGALEWD